jgi:multidrug efflux pump subunit AcrB
MKGKMKRGPIAWMANNPVAANLLMCFFLGGGLVALFFMIKQEVFPDIIRDTVTVTVPYPGASPEEVETGIILSIEENLRGIDGVKEVRSSANEGVGRVVAELYVTSNHSKVYQDIKSEVDRIRTFPENAEEPEVSLDSHRHGVMSIALYGNTDRKSLRELAELLRERFLEDSHISQVDIHGTPDFEISIEVPLENLRRYGVTIEDIARRISATSVEIPAGGIKAESGEILVRMKERRDYGYEFGDIPVLTTAEGSQVLLRQIAQIDDGFEDTDRYAEFDGKPSVMLEIYRVGDETPISVADAAVKKMEELKSALPEGINLSVLRSRADIFRQRMDLLLRNGLLGLCLVVLLLGFFLELRLAFWVMMGIPVSFLAALMFMPLIGLSLNMITMFAFIIALGIVVDDAIVVGENIYFKHQSGMGFLDASIIGAKEVSIPVSFSIITNIIAFIPLALLPGFMGKILWMLPAVVVIAFSVSWIECLFILPAHVGHFKEKTHRFFGQGLHRLQQRFSHWFLAAVRKHYGPFIRFAISHRYLVVVIAISLLTVVIAYVKSGRMGFQVFPKVESDYAYAYAVMPYGTPIKITEDVTRKILAAAQQVVKDSGHPELTTGIFADIGKDGSHTTEIRVYLAATDIRKHIMSTQEFVDKWRKQTGQVPGVETFSFQADRGGPGSGAALTVELQHRDLDVLELASADLAKQLSTVATVSDIDDGFQPGKEQLDFKITAEGESLGFTANAVARRLRAAYEGAEALRQQRGRNEIKVKVRLPENERMSEYDLMNLIIRTPQGGEVPVCEVLELTRHRAYTNIGRRDGKRTVNVTADVKPRSKTGEVITMLDKEVMPELMHKYPGLTYSYEGRQADSRESLGAMAIMIPVILLLIYATLAIPFRSYLQPLIVMTSIPFGIVGAVIGHLIMGYSLCLFSIIGIIALSGVVVNDALVLIDCANRLRKEGKTPHEAAVAAGIQRFRPILLTTLTTFCGLMPMIFETSRQARFLIPLAISLGYGILFATLITLVLVPSLYMIVDDVHKKGQKASHAE